jgi:cell division septum initiation protein DivIVA
MPHLRFSLIVFAAIAAASLAPAQRGGGPRGPQGAEDDGGYAALAARAYQQSRLDRFSELFRLNKEQKNEAKEIFDAAQKEAAPVRDQILKSRTDLASAYLTKRPQAEIDQLTASYAGQVTQMTSIEMRAFAKLYESLNPDQQKKAGAAFPLVTGMFYGRDWNRIGN